jgi:hypothetical protein
MTQHSRKWSSSGLGLDASEAEARRLEKKGTFKAVMDDEAGTVTLSKDDFKAVMGKLGGHKQTAKRSQTNLIFLAFGYLAVSVGFIAVIVGLMNWRIESSKESHVRSGEMVGLDGAAVKTGDLVSFAGLYDLPKLDVKTLVETKKVITTLENGEEMAFVVTGATKRPNSRSIKLLTPGGVITVNGDTMKASATINGVVFPVKAADESQRRQLREEGRKLLHAKSDFFNSRALAASGGSSAQLGISAGSESTDTYDGSDPVSGRVEFIVNGTDVFMTVRFQANARINVVDGVFNENGEASVQVTDMGTTVGVQVDNEPGRFINIVEMSSGDVTYLGNDFVAHGTHNGTFTSTYCSTESTSPVVIVSSDHATVTADTSAFTDFEGMGPVTTSVTLDDVFTPIAYESQVLKSCGAIGMDATATSRRLAIEDPGRHFKEYYHDPIMKKQASIPKEEWTEEHHTHAQSLALIRKLYGNERELGYTAAGNAAQDVYTTSRSDVTCVNRNSWIGGFKGQACYIRQSCLFGFRGSQDNADWADNILGSIWVEYHHGRLVHKGFMNQLNGLLKDTSIRSQVNGCRHPTFTGHSLGGAMAYAARAYFNKGAINNYAAPATYLAHYAYWKPSGDSYRTWHTNDPVPYATNLVRYQHTFGSREVYRACCGYHRVCLPYPCGCGWRGCRTCWGACFNAWCNCHRWDTRGAAWYRPKASMWGTLWDIGANIVSVIRGTSHYHNMAVYYQPYAARQ